MSKDPRGLHPPTEAQRAEAERQVRHKAEPFSRLFVTEDGKQVLKALEASFDSRELVTADPHTTTTRAAQRDVVKYIHHMIKIGSGEGNE